MIGHSQLIADALRTHEHLQELGSSLKLNPHPPSRKKLSQHPPSPKKKRHTPPEIMQIINDIVRQETKSPPPCSISSFSPDSFSPDNKLSSDEYSWPEPPPPKVASPAGSGRRRRDSGSSSSGNSSSSSTTKIGGGGGGGGGGGESIDSNTLWIFGYGSLLWKCEYPILQFVWGSVQGYHRRLWQGSPDHRGTEKRPGRVFTMLPANVVDQLEAAAGVRQQSASPGDNIVWGRCFELERANAVEVMKEIDHREIAGFSKDIISVMCVDGIQRDATVYAALADNEHFLGPARATDIAAHCWCSSGPSGRNDEYVTKTSKALIDAGIKFGHDGPRVDEHLKAVCARLELLQSTVPVTARADFERLSDGVGLYCRGRPVQIVGTQREEGNSITSVTSEWPIVYYKFLENGTDCVYHCNVYDDETLLPFSKAA